MFGHFLEGVYQGVFRRMLYLKTGEDLGVGAGADTPSQGFDPLPTPFFILRFPYLVADPKKFPKAPSAPIYTNFEGVKIFQNVGQNFPKVPTNAILDCFFSKFCLRREKLDQNRVFLLLWESSDNQFGRPKKRSTNFRKF